MATDGANGHEESRGRIILNGVIYEPVSSIAPSRQQRSRVSMYDDSEFRRMEPYKYKGLRSTRRRTRLLRLHGEGFVDSEITCDFFEVEYDREDENIVRRVSSRAERSTRRERRERRQSSRRTPNHHNDVQALDIDDEVVEYEALSWCWGQEPKDRAIRIQEGGGYYRLAVTRELLLALKNLRHLHKERILWIDALCINQVNHEERNHQVQMMARIYRGAEQVCIWLGETADDSTQAIAFIREIMTLEPFELTPEGKENASKWQSLLLLMQRPWFSRRWVVQEIALARSATIYCGSDKIPWTSFEVAVELFVDIETATHRLSEVMRKDSNVPQWFEHISELGASVLVQATGKIFRRDGNQFTDTEKEIDPRIRYQAHRNSRRSLKGVPGTSRLVGPSRPSILVPQRPLLSLEYLVSSLSAFQATQPRDAIYSLLAIARDAQPFAELHDKPLEESEKAIIFTMSRVLWRKPFRIDYSRAYSDVCKDFVSFCIRVNGKSNPTRALDILCRPWAPEPEVTVGGVIHRKPTLYKFVPSHKRDKLRPVVKSNRPKFRLSAQYPPIDINQQIEDPNQRVGAPMLRELDKRSTEDYWRDCEEDWKKNWQDRYRSFEKDVKPFLPKRRGPPRKSKDEEEQESTDVSEQSESEEEDNARHYEEQNKQAEDITLPSWISRVSGASFSLYRHPGMHKQGRIGRMNADPLVGLPQDHHKNYSAAQNTRVDLDSNRRLRFRKRPISGHCSLFTEGFILTEVETVAESARLGAIPETWTKVAGWENALDGQSDPPAEFWRTLVADRGKDGRNPPYYYATACRESVRKGGLRGGAVDTGALINSEKNSMIAEFCRRVQAVIWNRCLIKTGGPLTSLGLASQHVRKGDLVCVLFGCTVPVILRRFTKYPGDLEKEKMQDGIEAMRIAMEICEEACLRKLRYQKRLQKERERGGDLDKIWKAEVLEELEEVNSQTKLWRKWEEEDRDRKWALYEEQRSRKWKSVHRQKTAKMRRNDAWRQPLLNRSTTMPGSRLVSTAESTPSIMVKGGTTEDSGGVGSTQPTFTRRHDQDGQDGARRTSHHAPEELEGDWQSRHKKARDEDPHVYYEFMGEAYIHGMMDGEAIRLSINESIPTRMFEIR